MIVVALADIHDDTQRLEEMADDLAGADVVLLVGDITDFGRERAVARVVAAVRHYNDRILAVPGNCDYPEVEDYLTSEGLNLHRKSTVVEGVAFIGLGGSLPCPGQTPMEYSDGELGGFLEEAAAELSPDMPAVLVSHEPPCESDVDLAYTGQHVGSAAVRQFIEERQPMVCFVGHIHEGLGLDTIGKTTVVNPGPLRSGGYGYGVISDGTIKVQVRRCRPRIGGQDV